MSNTESVSPSSGRSFASQRLSSVEAVLLQHGERKELDGTITPEEASFLAELRAKRDGGQ